MGRAWDRALPPVDIWREALRVLKPGAFAFVMCIPRQDCLARMAVGLEDAGFVVSFTSLYWAYASGFPKAQNIGKAVDKRKGTTPDQSKEFAKYIKARREKFSLGLTEVDRFVCNGTTNYSWFEGRPAGQRLPRLNEYQKIKQILQLDNRFDEFIGEAEREIIGKSNRHNSYAQSDIINPQGKGGVPDITLPATPQAQALDGSYAGMQVKPAVEVILCVMKPLSEKTYVDQALRNGKGVTWLDEGRIPYEIKENEGLTGKRPCDIIKEKEERLLCSEKPTKSSVSNAEKRNGQEGVEEKIGERSFAQENVDTLGSGKIPGKQQLDMSRQGILCSEEISTESSSTNSSTDTSGRHRKAQSPKDTRSIISMKTKRTIESKTLKSGQSQPTEDTTIQKADNSPHSADLTGGKTGRFPANLLASDDALNDGRVIKSSYATGRGKMKYFGGDECGIIPKTGRFDDGSFSRYFSLDSWFAKKLAELPKGVQRTFPFLIVSKASKAEKNRGCEEMELKIQKTTGRGIDNTMRRCPVHNQPIPSGVNTYGCGCKIQHEKVDFDRPKTNYHPTCKPLKLFSYLITLGSRPGDVVLDPFIGSGTTAIAARMLRRRYIGYETDPDYCRIAEARLAAVQERLI